MCKHDPKRIVNVKNHLGLSYLVFFSRIYFCCLKRSSYGYKPNDRRRRTKTPASWAAVVTCLKLNTPVFALRDFIKVSIISSGKGEESAEKMFVS